MAYSIHASISPLAAAHLILLNEVDLREKWPDSQASEVIHSISKLTINEILNIIDIADAGFIASDEIPQFGNIDSLLQVPSIVLRDGKSGGINYALLGFKLKHDVNAKLEANIKFGENHGKGAALLGLVSLNNKRFEVSSLTSCFCKLSNEEKKRLIQILYFRIPIVQAILKQAKDTSINGYDFMSGIAVSTRIRRGQCIRAIMSDMKKLNYDPLSHRIDNVFWDADGQGA